MAVRLFDELVINLTVNASSGSPLDLSTATNTVVLVGIRSDFKSLTATVVGDGHNVLRANTNDATFDRIGAWSMQARYTLDGRTVTTSASTFDVGGVVDAI